ncbi:zinc-binding oxidoreductase [Phaeosphaeriaceae sp. PMI808]|nr:zinc-binding oxidoreductase [Phaeosphaeriaceae sp. PMI808]
MSSTSTMKAYTHTRAGVAKDVLTQCVVPKPTITSPTQVLVQLSHCALNPAGSIVMQLVPFIFRASPAIPEMDFSGTIVEIGTDVPENRNLKPDTEVFGSIPLGQHVKSTCGALAEYIVVDHTSLVRKPDAAELKEVCGLGIAGATALELIKSSGLKAGDSVLINGAGGGIGHLVMQMCLAIVGPSGVVVAICSRRSFDWVQELGNRAKVSKFEVIDREQVDLIPHLTKSFGSGPGFDAVIDAVAIQEMFHSCPGFLKKGKPYVSVGPKAYSYTFLGMASTIWRMAKNFLWPQALGGTPRPYAQVQAVSNQESLEELAGMVEEGILRVYVGLIVSWEDIDQAYRQLLDGHARGKLVVVVDNKHSLGT